MNLSGTSEWLKFGYHAIEPRFDKKEQSLEFERSFFECKKIYFTLGRKIFFSPMLEITLLFCGR